MLVSGRVPEAEKIPMEISPDLPCLCCHFPHFFTAHRLSSAMLPCSLTVPSLLAAFIREHIVGFRGGWKGAEYGFGRFCAFLFDCEVSVGLFMFALCIYFFRFGYFFDWLVLILYWVGLGGLAAGFSVERLRWCFLIGLFAL